MKRALVFWFTGLSGSGKTTVAGAVRVRLESGGRKVLVLDGDEVRRRLHADLGFAPAEIKENNSRIAGLCRAERAHYDVILVPIISPYAESRRAARESLGDGFFEIFFDADLECVMARDAKGLYTQARRGQLKGLIGYSPESPYEWPSNPDFIVRTQSQSVEKCVEMLYKFVARHLHPSGRCGDHLPLNKGRKTAQVPPPYLRRGLGGGKIYDVFNGDADGLCAAHQLRLARNAQGIVVTGPKRDIRLLERIRPKKGDEIFVCDVSLDANRRPLKAMLKKGVTVHYFDHHFFGRMPKSRFLKGHIRTSGRLCTSLIVNGYLKGRHRLWAAAGAFGDNLHEEARRLANRAGLDKKKIARLAELGELLNYNAYGESPRDLHFDPRELYAKMRPYADPLAFASSETAVRRLRAHYKEDRRRMEALKPVRDAEGVSVYVLKDEPWCRRVCGVLANRRIRENGRRAVAVATPRKKGIYLVGVRVSSGRMGADKFCRRFGGGGRATAAGVDFLPRKKLGNFLRAFQETYAELRKKLQGPRW